METPTEVPASVAATTEESPAMELAPQSSVTSASPILSCYPRNLDPIPFVGEESAPVVLSVEPVENPKDVVVPTTARAPAFVHVLPSPMDL